MSKCAALMLKWAKVARGRDMIARHEAKRSGCDVQHYGSETSSDHYRAWYLASQLIAGTYTA
ncbi:hypothetical protein [Burkholderia sp. Ac-20365]|uniref:hypothetical protein n=1 Tax=Burkholderia sp. Ac-20365 TaxID=2703897 RepID=UPI00197C42C7|nr:hypothetical protein [Burkholderia sp. Ac-20365]MBN3760895.1 hypothetical protein [Burkholderia sp. Ac-20365]